MDFKNLFDGISSKMKIDFDNITSVINHNPSKGKERERLLIREYLRNYLPKNIGLTNGEIISIDGQVSGECDIVIYDETQCPILIQDSGYRIIPNECVYGVIEVKSLLNQHELSDAQPKLQFIKNMPKIAYFKQHGVIEHGIQAYERHWNYFPTLCIIFAYDSIDLIKLKTQLDEVQKGLELYEKIDNIWVLKKGYITNWSDSTKETADSPGSDTRMRCISSENILFALTVHIQSMFHAAWMPKFRMEEYYKLGDIIFGKYIEP